MRYGLILSSLTLLLLGASCKQPTAPPEQKAPSTAPSTPGGPTEQAKPPEPPAPDAGPADAGSTRTPPGSTKTPEPGSGGGSMDDGAKEIPRGYK